MALDNTPNIKRVAADIAGRELSLETGRIAGLAQGAVVVQYGDSMVLTTAIGEEQQRTDSASVRRAMGNLRAVLVNRLRSRDLDEATVHQVVALIDEAAQKIERL